MNLHYFIRLKKVLFLVTVAITIFSVNKVTKEIINSKEEAIVELMKVGSQLDYFVRLFKSLLIQL